MAVLGRELIHYTYIARPLIKLKHSSLSENYAWILLDSHAELTLKTSLDMALVNRKV